jgi:guanine deaminase
VRPAGMVATMMLDAVDERYLREAIARARAGALAGLGGPFGAVIVRDGRVLGGGENRVPTALDPTAHAEVMAIREACARERTFRLDGATIYASCEPCPMCLAAIYWARLARVVYACTREDAAAIGFDDALFYRELSLPPEQRAIPMLAGLRTEGLTALRAWCEKADRTAY